MEVSKSFKKKKKITPAKRRKKTLLEKIDLGLYFRKVSHSGPFKQFNTEWEQV